MFDFIKQRNREVFVGDPALTRLIDDKEKGYNDGEVKNR
jgi:hypothetical protein